LSQRQREVLQLLAEGHTMKEIARVLKITPRTVAFHKYSMMETLGITSNAQLIQYALKRHPAGTVGGMPTPAGLQSGGEADVSPPGEVSDSSDSNGVRNR
jgi:DNA-binding CsgD family transcriptional regulator